ncbi:nucleoside diphosphate kinase 5-like [Vespula maculifrons]|uniref:Nucleoside diphosphate kinase 5-like n=1 Tax=Vespula maculifrons TaxID=7453 RepID=A0ABD2AVM9_VESMC|nr:nucleoside diphosphate kinase homolog 5-like [Vespula vulgaris]
MCDCSAKKNDKKEIPKTVTLFEKCRKPYRAGKNIELYSTNDGLNDKKQEIQFLQKESYDAVCCNSLQQLSLSECSSDSTRLYKFVSPRTIKYYGDEEEEEKPLPFIYKPCMTLPDEVEKEPDIEHTLAIIKPESMIYRRQIEQRIYEEGFEICQTRWLQLTPEQASDFYSDHYGQAWFAHLIAYISSTPIIVFVLAKHHAIHDWRFIMGPMKIAEARLYFPDSLRAKYGIRGEDFKNAVHGSSTRENAEKEIHFFFPETVIEPLLVGQSLIEYLWETINPILTEGLTLCCKLKPADPLLWLAHWLILNNPNKPRLPEDLALIPT